ncbi:MAG: hypothetical protein QNJ98_18615 [Planctomycetota bacterium]|nr:hypothetical protein [Planctomycetota bacterium]
MAPRAATHPIPLDVPRITGTLLRIVVLLALLSTLGQLLRHLHGREHAYGFVPLFYMDEENNVPTFFATLLLLMAAGALLATGAVRRGNGERDARKWTVLGVVFLVLAVDEAASLHEMTIEPMRALLGQPDGLLRFAWVVPGALFVAVMAITYVPFLRALPRATARGFVLAGVLFVGGAIGLELVEGIMMANDGGPSLGLSMAVNVEETLEMLGVVLLIHTVLCYLAEQGQGVAMVFARGGPEDEAA